MESQQLSQHSPISHDNNTCFISCSREPPSCLSSNCSVTFTTEWAVPTAVHDDPKPSQSIWLVILRTPIYDSVYTLSNVAYVLSTWATFTVSAVSIISWNASEHSIT
ncbi:hypothetical protein FZC28_6639g2054 [Saccharomyces cerevisiae]|nr:hypothetical protein FZC28_6639g2054 [Saccharomyces cerevisiae]KAJ1053816.1 hypothetical protein FZC27_7730g1968 [Saccharomyces cerevisiae]